ncbi:MAG TPA: SGNH/GDSL hydrolase family protein [Chloroflexota bacterium]|nr:SGNH/GDSL hydrolase family protein [Chloroflexota bacterium]
MLIVLSRALLVIVAMALPLVGLEAALRMFGPFLPGSYAASLYLEPHPIYGFFHVPSTTGWIRTDEYTTRVDINALGLRERSIGYENPAGLRRVLVLGDSLVEGVQVPEGSLATRKLETLLSGQTGRPNQVINAGVGAWGTAQEYLFLKTEGPQYRPDWVVLFFYTGNDVTNNGVRIKRNTGELRKPYYDIGPDGSLTALPYRPRKKSEETLVDQFRRSSLLFDVFDSTVFSPARSASADDDESADRQLRLYELPVFSSRSSRPWEDAWQVTEGLIRAVQDESTSLGAAFLLVNVPTKWEVYPEDWSELRNSYHLPSEGWDLEGPNRRLAAFAATQGIPYLDLRTSLRQAASGPRLYFHRDIHWTTEGQARAGEAVAERLMREESDDPRVPQLGRSD